MSYSFSVAAGSKADAKAKVAEQLDQVVAGQPMHARDRDAALAAAGAFIDLLRDPDGDEQIGVSVHGSVGWVSGGVDAQPPLVGAGVGVSAQITSPGSL